MPGAFDIRHLPLTAMKGQVLVDLVAKFTKELDYAGPEEVGMPEEGLRVNVVSFQQTWKSFVDGATNQRD